MTPSQISPASAPRMPAVFVGHGSPMNALEHNRYTAAWLALAQSLPRPRAVLAISAHWYVPGTRVTAMSQPRTIHDFGGFPRELFAVQYPAPGDPALAAQIREHLGAPHVALDEHWGLDHGTWSVLAQMYPDADVPVVQLSIDVGLGPRGCYELGAQLRFLREQGVLILGSGNVVHNLGLLRWGADTAPYPWAARFEAQFSAGLLAGDDDALIGFASSGADARLSIPTPEHYLPLLYVLGADAGDEPRTVVCDGIELGSISMLSFRIG